MDVVIGLGSNMGDRFATLRSAWRALSGLGEILASSPIYVTTAVGPPQDDFANAAVLLRTDRSPHALLDELLRIEREHGRVRRERWGPRTLDLDVLYIEGITVDDERLKVPHPRLEERAFARIPLLDVLPSAPYSAPADRHEHGVFRTPFPLAPSRGSSSRPSKPEGA